MTREELLACLEDRPCSVCEFHTEEGCNKWFCVFEEEPDDPSPDLQWDRLYNYLNDMRFGIAPDETTPDDERREREAQVDVLDEIIEWIEITILRNGTEGEQE